MKNKIFQNIRISEMIIIVLALIISIILSQNIYVKFFIYKNGIILKENITMFLSEVLSIELLIKLTNFTILIFSLWSVVQIIKSEKIRFNLTLLYHILKIKLNKIIISSKIQIKTTQKKIKQLFLKIQIRTYNRIKILSQLNRKIILKIINIFQQIFQKLILIVLRSKQKVVLRLQYTFNCQKIIFLRIRESILKIKEGIKLTFQDLSLDPKSIKDLVFSVANHLNKKEIIRKLILIFLVNITILTIIAGSVDFKDITGKSFVAASVDEPCDGVQNKDLGAVYNLCDDGETCCNADATVCTDTATVGYTCVGNAADATGDHYDNSKTACEFASCAASGAVATACDNSYTDQAWVWYPASSGGTGALCCGDDGANDDFYYIVTSTSPDRCETCLDGSVGTNSTCYQNQGCTMDGELHVQDLDTTCSSGTTCYCYWGESCQASGYTAPNSAPLPDNCDEGGFYDGLNANCYADLANKCYNSTVDPCTSTGLNYTIFDCYDPGLAVGPSCYYDSNSVGVNESDSCNISGCVGVGNDTYTFSCDSGSITDDYGADCFVNGAGVDNGTCYYDTTDPCDADNDGWDYSISTACADEGNISADGQYCYYDEGCTTSGPNSSCSLGEKIPECDSGGMSESGANCEMKNSQPSNVDVCAYSSTDACLADDDGWDYTNDTDVAAGVTCTTCDSDYQEDFSNDKCYYNIQCSTLGWTSSSENCFEYCWDSDLTTANCLGSQTLTNRTEPANDSTCYYSRTCIDPINGCGWSTDTMRQDFCDQCGPNGVYNGTSYCPPINSSCTSNCANSGTIWYGDDSINRCANTECNLSTDTLTYGDIWGGNGSKAFCDDTECNSDAISLGYRKGYCDAGTCTFVDWCSPPTDTDWEIDYAETCDGVTKTAGAGKIIILPGGSLTLLNGANVTASGLELLTTGDLIFIDQGSELELSESKGADVFILQNSSGQETISFSSLGNIDLAGSCFAGACEYPGDDAFIVEDAAGNVVAYVNATGDLCIEDVNCGDNDANCDDAGDGSFIVRNNAGTNVAYINSTGGLCLIGDLL